MLWCAMQGIPIYAHMEHDYFTKNFDGYFVSIDSHLFCVDRFIFYGNFIINTLDSLPGDNK